MAFTKIGQEKKFALAYDEEEKMMLTEVARAMKRSRNSTLKMLIRYGYGYFVVGKEMPDRLKEVPDKLKEVS